MRENLLDYITWLLEEKLPFFVLRKKGHSVVQLMHQNDQMWYKNAPDKIAYSVFQKFQNNKDQVFIASDVYKEFSWSVEQSSVVEEAIELSSNEKKEHHSMVAAAVEKLKKGTLRKVVLSLSTEVSRSSQDLEIWTKLLDRYPSANCYFFYHPSVGKWMGATPEVLLSYKSGSITTMSLAGTQKGQDPFNITWGEKEKEEQQIVTDYIKTSLQQTTGHPVVVGEVHTVQAGSIFHLNTLLEVPARFDQVYRVAQGLHPTPAVCGLPKDDALEYILEHEKHDRSFYTGYMGIYSPLKKEADLFVNLRCIELYDDRIKLYAGGGITAMSDPAAEVEEIQNKLSTMASIL